MPGLSKESTQVSVVVSHEPLKESAALFDGVPVEVIEYFSLDPNEMPHGADRKIKEVYEMVREEGMTLGDTLKKLKEIENRVGQNQFGETRYDRIRNWIKLNLRIKELEKQREALERW